MATMPEVYDPKLYEPARGREDPLPPSEYDFEIVNADVRDTRAGDGKLLWLEFEVVSGAHTGRKFWDNINLQNPNPQAVEIGQRQLSALCHSVGFLDILKDSDLLISRRGRVRLGVKPPQGDFAAQNKVLAYLPRGATSPSEPFTNRPAAGRADGFQGTGGGRNKRPWE